MKKVFVLILTVVLVMSLAAPAFAVKSPQKEPTDLITMEGCTCEIIVWSQRHRLSAGKKAAFEAAKECLEDAVPEGYAARDLVYFLQEDECTSCCVEIVMAGEEEPEEGVEVGWTRTNGEVVCGAWETELPMEENAEIMLMQYLHDEWVVKEITVEDEHIIVEGVVDGPLALLSK